MEDHIREWATKQKQVMEQRSPIGMGVAMEGYLRALHAKRLDVTLENGAFSAGGQNKFKLTNMPRYEHGHWLRSKPFVYTY